MGGKAGMRAVRCKRVRGEGSEAEQGEGRNINESSKGKRVSSSTTQGRGSV